MVNYWLIIISVYQWQSHVWNTCRYYRYEPFVKNMNHKESSFMYKTYVRISIHADKVDRSFCLCSRFLFSSSASLTSDWRTPEAPYTGDSASATRWWACCTHCLAHAQNKKLWLDRFGHVSCPTVLSMSLINYICVYYAWLYGNYIWHKNTVGAFC